MPVAIIAALREELSTLLDEMRGAVRSDRFAGREAFVGRIGDTECVVALSGIGKVAAATTATALIERYPIEAMVFVGVAGSAARHVRIGDIVVATSLVQHDMDASPLFPRFEVPLTGRARFDTDRAWTARTVAAAERFATHLIDREIPAAVRAEFAIDRPAVHCGLIASGDEFVHAADRIVALRAALPDLLAVEMEGAAVAQVCDAYSVALTVIRTISDTADHSAAIDFARYTEQIASRYAHIIVRELLSRTDLQPIIIE